MQLVETLVEHEQIARTVVVAARVYDPLAMVPLLSDHRYRAVIDSAPSWFDGAETVEIAIVESRLAAEAAANGYGRALIEFVRFAAELERGAERRAALSRTQNTAAAGKVAPDHVRAAIEQVGTVGSYAL